MQDSIKSIHWSCTGDEVLALQLKGVAKQLLFKHLAEMQKSTVLSMSRLYRGAKGNSIFISVDSGMINITLNAGQEDNRTESKYNILVGFGCVPGVDKLYSLAATKDARIVWFHNNKWRSSTWSIEKIILVITTGRVINKSHNTVVFGNVDWKGPEVSDDTQSRRKVLTWKGPPSRYWPIDIFTEVEGVTVVDHVIEGVLQDTYYYTPFSGKVYEHGRALETMPEWYWPNGANNNHAAQVLGAAYRAIDGKLFCIVKTCYLRHPIEAEQKYGYYFEVITKNGGDWERLLQIETLGMPNTNWFFSEDGTKAVTILYGALHKITLIRGFDLSTTCTHTVEAVGKFETEITTDVHNASTNWVADYRKEHPDIILPSGGGGTGPTAEGFFAYRPDKPEYARTVAPFINKYGLIQDYTTTYSDTKSGKIIIAADYQKNELVTLDAKLSGSQSVYLHARSTQAHKGRAAWLRSSISWKDVSVETANCSYRADINDGSPYHYYYTPGRRYAVRLVVSDIPDNVTVHPLEGLLFNTIFFTPTTITSCTGCHNSTAFDGYAIVRSPVWTDYFSYAGGLYTLNQGLANTNTGCTGNNDTRPVGSRFEGTLDYLNVWTVFVDSGGIYCNACGYCTRYYQETGDQFRKVGCASWLSDSWKQNLVDWKGDPVTVPTSVGGYLVKVLDARDQICFG